MSRTALRPPHAAANVSGQMDGDCPEPSRTIVPHRVVGMRRRWVPLRGSYALWTGLVMLMGAAATHATLQRSVGGPRVQRGQLGGWAETGRARAVCPDLWLDSAIDAALGPRPSFPMDPIARRANFAETCAGTCKGAGPNFKQPYDQKLPPPPRADQQIAGGGDLPKVKTGAGPCDLLEDLTSSADITDAQRSSAEDPEIGCFKAPAGLPLTSSAHSEVHEDIKAIKGDMEIQQALLEGLATSLDSTREEAATLLRERDTLQEKITRLGKPCHKAYRAAYADKRRRASTHAVLTEFCCNSGGASGSAPARTGDSQAAGKLAAPTFADGE